MARLPDDHRQQLAICSSGENLCADKIAAIIKIEINIGSGIFQHIAQPNLFFHAAGYALPPMTWKNQICNIIIICA